MHSDTPRPLPPSPLDIPPGVQLWITGPCTYPFPVQQVVAAEEVTFPLRFPPIQTAKTFRLKTWAAGSNL
jgi:hypothetical protein